LLEDLLADYPGTLLLVSHDRDFLDNVVTSTLVMEGGGRVGEYVGGYSDWERQRARIASASAAASMPATSASAQPVPATPAAGKRKRSFKETHELEQLPGKIEALEARVAAMTAAMGDPAWY